MKNKQINNDLITAPSALENLAASAFESLRDLAQSAAAAPFAAIIAPEKSAAAALENCASFFGFAPFVLPDVRAFCEEDLEFFRDELCELVGILSAQLGANSSARAANPQASGEAVFARSHGRFAGSVGKIALDDPHDLSSRGFSSQPQKSPHDPVAKTNFEDAGANSSGRPANSQASGEGDLPPKSADADSVAAGRAPASVAPAPAAATAADKSAADVAGKSAEKPLFIIPESTAALRGLLPLAAPIELRALETFAHAGAAGPRALAEALLAAGFCRAATVLAPAEFAANGDKIDLFAPGAAAPVRVVFFGDEIESMRAFDVATQLAQPEELECLRIAALPSRVLPPVSAGTDSRADAATTDDRPATAAATATDATDSLASQLAAVQMRPAREFADAKFHISEEFFALNAGKKITLLAANDSLLAALAVPPAVRVLRSPAVLNIANSREIICSLNLPRARRVRRRIRLDLNATRPGDYVVHERYGIGKFEGLELVRAAGSECECLRIVYAGGNALLLPTHALAAIEPYAANSTPQLDTLGKASFAKLAQKVREKLYAIAEKIAALAAARALNYAPKIAPSPRQQAFARSAGFELTEGQSEAIAVIFADMQRGYAMDRLLSADVGFGKTEVAMHAAFATAEAGLCAVVVAPTTLLCAQHYATFKARFEDFGIRVFRLDSSVKKAAVLREIAEHMAGSAGTTDADAADSPAADKSTPKGAVIVATHSILTAMPERVGLLIIDEEHKFGVRQKERIKELALRSHALAMSATPIPRTLSAALAGLRSYSEISTPPNERLGVASACAVASDALVKEILLRERRRGGQSFFVHNRLATLEQRASNLEQMLPGLRTACISSATPAGEKERILAGFLRGDFEVLCSTSIVESGLDMPRANTIIIERADLFGVADLHQLRGRVGRGDRQGFCYFLTGEDTTPQARERLGALCANSYLGAGAALAQMDLQLRGGGNLLGEQQSGHIEAIGYGMYVRLLEEQINLINRRGLVRAGAAVGDGGGGGDGAVGDGAVVGDGDGDSGDLSGRVGISGAGGGVSASGAARDGGANGGEIALSCEIKLAISAYLDAEQIADDGLRLEFYRRLARAKTPRELGRIESEFTERFSAPEGASERYFALVRLRLACERAGVCALSSFEANVKFSFASGASEVIKAPSARDEDVLRAALEHANKLAERTGR